MKKCPVSFVSFRTVAVAAAVSFSMCASAGTEYFVDCNRPDDTGDGLSEATAKRTIQAAVDCTDPGGRDIVTVLPGVYDEGKRVSPAYSDHEFRVVITNQLLLRSRDGAATTIIKGSFGSGENKLGTGAVRGIYMRGPSYAAIEGFTITGCATTNTVASGNAHYGAAVVGSWNQYVLGCVISNNHAVAGAGIYNCNGVRCLFTKNSATAGAVGINSWYWNSVMTDNSGSQALNYTVKMVNCTCTGLAGNIAGGRDQCFQNCVLVGNSGDCGYSNYTSLSNSVTDSASDVFLSVGGNSVTEASKYQFVAPAFGDWRLIEGSPAVGLADWDEYYSFVSSGQKLTVAVNDNNKYLPKYLVDEYVYKDYAGNDISAEKSMDAGAIQGAVPVEGGRLDFLTAGFHKDGGQPCRVNSYAYTTNWPAVLQCRIVQANGNPTFACRVSGNYVTSSRSYVFPDLDERFTFAFPPKGTSSELTSYAVQRIYYVDDDDGSDEYDGSSEDQAFKTLQKAADAVKDNGGYYNLVRVAPGVYNEGGVHGRGLTNRLHVSGLSIQFVATEGPDVTFIEGAPDPESDFHGLGPNATRCLYWFTPHKEAAMRGFTFRNGHTSFTDGDKWNGADANIAAVAYVYTESDGKVQLLDCVFSNNTALISAVNMSGDFTRCRFTCNKAVTAQGSIGRNGTYRFCSFYGNDQRTYTLDNSVQNIYFCSVQGRAAPFQSGIYGCVLVDPGVTTEVQKDGSTRDYDGNVIWPACTVSPGNGSTGLINYIQADPMLADLESGDMHLLAGSPALGAADVADITNVLHYVTSDLDGNMPNFVNGIMTAGAYQIPSMSIAISGREDGLGIEGGVYGVNALRPGETIKVTASERLCGRRFEGFVVNGEPGLPSEREFSYTVPSMPTENMTIEALYGNLGTVMTVR